MKNSLPINFPFIFGVGRRKAMDDTIKTQNGWHIDQIKTNCHKFASISCRKLKKFAQKRSSSALFCFQSKSEFIAAATIKNLKKIFAQIHQKPCEVSETRTILIIDFGVKMSEDAEAACWIWLQNLTLWLLPRNGGAFSTMESKPQPKLMLTKLKRTYDGMIAEFGSTVTVTELVEEAIDI